MAKRETTKKNAVNNTGKNTGKGPGRKKRGPAKKAENVNEATMPVESNETEKTIDEAIVQELMEEQVQDTQEIPIETVPEQVENALHEPEKEEAPVKEEPNFMKKIGRIFGYLWNGQEVDY